MKKLFFSIFVAVAALCSCQKLGELVEEEPLGTVECRAVNIGLYKTEVFCEFNIPGSVMGCKVGVFVTTDGDPMSQFNPVDLHGGFQDILSGQLFVIIPVTGLTPETYYKVRACIVNTLDGRVVWSEMDAFSTNSPSNPVCVSFTQEKVGTTYAHLKANWEERGCKITKTGFVYAFMEKNLDNSYATIVEGDPTFVLEGLEMSKTYYVKAFAVADGDTVYSNVIEFTTRAPQAGNAVDLGLSVKWSDMNLGAFAPEEFGDYFAWGETVPKVNYNLSTYLFFNSFHPAYTKYVTKDSFGTVDNKSVLEKSDDPASLYLGGNWRVPTRAELNELISECNWTFTTVDGVGGFLVQSKKSGYTDKSIFLPAAGIKGVNGSSYVGSEGVYWSSNLETVNNTGAYALNVVNGGRNSTLSYYRLNGCSIRPVTK
ncbi:MAG: hypothetical protein MJZ07_05165 [Bacteroidales bacterium]|nr:hypothetical protein [Bacteroidales bacterium]